MKNEKCKIIGVMNREWRIPNSLYRRSTVALYAIVGLAVLVFGAFFLIGYDIPYAEDPRFTEPLLTGLLLSFVFLLLIVALAAAVISVVITVRRRGNDGRIVNGIPAKRIALGAGGLLAVSLLLTFALGSSSPVSVNGKLYTDAFWLRTADMFIFTSLVLLLSAVIAVICSNAKNILSRR